MMSVFQMAIIVVVTTSAIVVVIVDGRFAYERGHCEVSITNMLQELINRQVVNAVVRNGSDKSLRYDLYTRLNPYERQVLIADDETSLGASNFNATWPIRISIHGWTGKGTTCSNAAVKDAYMARGDDFNVIIVDWSDYSMDISYARLSKQLPTVAEKLAHFLRFLHRHANVAYGDIYLIGHSAGSHIAGLAGKILKPELLGAIYAVDPAGLAQLNAIERQRLAASDARYVESVHTDVVLLGNPSVRLSHASFFPNWGHGQPHCPNATAAEFDFACDHFAALYYFVESVKNPTMFGAVQCKNMRNIEANNCGCKDSCEADVYMGGEPARPKRGIFYFSTNNRSPYGYGSRVQTRPSSISRSKLIRAKNSKIKRFLSNW